MAAPQDGRHLLHRLPTAPTRLGPPVFPGGATDSPHHPGPARRGAERQRQVPEAPCFILRGGEEKEGSSGDGAAEGRGGRLQVGGPAGPGWAALARGEGFPEEVFAGGLAIPLG